VERILSPLVGYRIHTSSIAVIFEV